MDGKNMKPILFNTDMVRAILDGRKTATRRVVKPTHGGVLEIHDDLGGVPCLCEKCGTLCRGLKPPYQPGNILYVREAFGRHPSGKYCYRADYIGAFGWGWHPSIHMPKDAARIFLRVTGVRVERLRDITDKQVKAEGTDTKEWFSDVWDSTIKKVDIPSYGWAANPWVWVIEFKRINRETESN